MQILVLPGIDPQTERWAKQLVAELGAAGQGATVQRYLHWQSNDTQVQREAEIDRLKGCTMELLIGKSLGVGLGLRASIKGFINPARAIFIGTPLTSLIKQGHDLQEMVQKASIPALFIQQKSDPLGGSASLREALPHRQIVEVPGSDHQYGDIRLLASHIQNWLRAG